MTQLRRSQSYSAVRSSCGVSRSPLQRRDVAQLRERDRLSLWRPRARDLAGGTVRIRGANAP
jgi:hypothetical protein